MTTLWTPTHGHTNVGKPAKTHSHQSHAGIMPCRRLAKSNE